VTRSVIPAHVEVTRNGDALVDADEINRFHRVVTSFLRKKWYDVFRVGQIKHEISTGRNRKEQI
jgi:hypothetical protein